MKECPGGSCGLSCSDGSCTDGTCGEGFGDVRLPPGMLTKYNLNQDVADGVMVFIDNFGTTGQGAAKLLGAIRRDYAGRVFGVVFGGPDLRELYPDYISMGLDTLYHIRNPQLTEYNPEGCASAIAELWERVRSASIFFNSSGVGCELAALVAGKLKAGIAPGAHHAHFRGRDVAVRSGMEKITFRGYPQVVVWDELALPERLPNQTSKGTTINRPYSHPSKIVRLKKTEVGNCVFVGSGCNGETLSVAKGFAEEAGVGMHEEGKLYGRCVMICPSESEYLAVKAAVKLCLFEGKPDFEIGHGDAVGKLSDLFS